MAHIRLTKNALLNGEAVKGFPLIVTASCSVDWCSLEYFLHLKRTCALSSIRTYAGHLVDCLAQLEVDNRSLVTIDERWLQEYKNSILVRSSHGKKNTEAYACQVIRTVVAYCYWLETSGYAQLLCGITREYAIQVSVRDNGSVLHPLALDKSADKRSALAPRSEWIETVKRHGPATDTASKKFDLMVDWYSSAGPRAHEICSLLKSRLPSLEAAKRAATDGRNLRIVLNKTKGGTNEPLPTSPLIIVRTWEYIATQRADVVRRFRMRSAKRGHKYAEPDEIFLSEKTGRAMTPKAVSNSVRQAFLKAVEAGALARDERVWLHGLRHHFATNFLKSLDSKNVRNPERIARVATRHRSEETLDGYANERFNSDFR